MTEERTRRWHEVNVADPSVCNDSLNDHLSWLLLLPLGRRINGSAHGLVGGGHLVQAGQSL
jgi:hypothetical protein